MRRASHAAGIADATRAEVKTVGLLTTSIVRKPAGRVLTCDRTTRAPKTIRHVPTMATTIPADTDRTIRTMPPARAAMKPALL